MFASETLLKHCSIATLEQHKAAAKWYVREMILTDRALYLYQEKAKLIVDKHHRLDLSLFRATKVMDENPVYSRLLPPLKLPYKYLIEMHNKKTQKRRVIACDSFFGAEELCSLLNLVNSFLTYEFLFSKDDKVKSGPSFIKNWFQSYLEHKGVMEFQPEVFTQGNFPYLLSFGRENDSIKKLVFNQNFLFVQNSEKLINQVQQIFNTFSKESVVQITFSGNYLTDASLSSFISIINQYDKLQVLEIANNGLMNGALEQLAAGGIFQNCVFLSKILLSNNLLGQGSNQTQSLDLFLYHIMTELENPTEIDLSYNKFTDESLMPFIKYFFANEECPLKVINLSENQFSNYGKRTLLVGFSKSVNKGDISFKCGPLTLTENSLKHMFGMQMDVKNVGTKTSPNEQRVIKRINIKEKQEITIRRKPNSGMLFLKGLPLKRLQREKLHNYLTQIDTGVINRNSISIEDIKDLLIEINQLEFEFPRHKLEPLFDVINEKLQISVECENIYCLELLLECLRLMNARNFKAEEKYTELAQIAMNVGKNLVKVINMEIMDDNELNTILDESLGEAKRIGMRGEIIDIAITLKILRNNFFQEMQTKNALSDEEEDNHKSQSKFEKSQLIDLNDEDKILNVYDDRYDKYIECTMEELELTTEVEANLGFHPYVANYLKISNLNLNYVRKNLKEAQKFLSDEESYAYRNIYDRSMFLLCDTKDSMKAQNLRSYYLGKNDSGLKLARIIFRYRNCLDELFPFKPEPQVAQQKVAISRKSNIFNQKFDFTRIFQYPQLQTSLDYTGQKLMQPLTKLEKNLQAPALAFNRILHSVSESLDKSKNQLYFEIQKIFEDCVILKGQQISQALTDEFFLQIFRQINKKGGGEPVKGQSTTHCLYILALLSRYANPSPDLLDSYELWLHSVRDKVGSELFRLFQIMLSNFQFQKQSEQLKPFVDWPPSFAEIENITTGEPIVICVYSPTGDLYKYQVDTSTTVESLMQEQVWKEKFFQKEPDPELYWLYKYIDKTDQFDQCLSKDKKILKLIFQQEKEESGQGFGRLGEEFKKISFMKQKKSNKGARKESIMVPVDVMHDSEFQNIIFLVKKRLFPSLHVEKNFKQLTKKPLNFLYSQLRMDFVEKKLLKKLRNLDEVITLAACILKIKNWGKILRSKDNSLTKELIEKNMDFAVPSCFLNEKPKEFWMEKIKKEFDKTIKDLTVEEAQDKFLTILAQYPSAFASCYIVKVQQHQADELDQDDLENDDMDMVESKSSNTSFLQNLRHTEALVALSFNGIFFYDNHKRDKILARIDYEDVLYVMGQENTLKVSFIFNQRDIGPDIKATFQTKGYNAGRCMAEDLISFCQLRLAETTKNDYVEVVKRNIINMFEEYDDPYQATEEDNVLSNPTSRQPTIQHTKTLNMNRKGTTNNGVLDLSQLSLEQYAQTNPYSIQKGFQYKFKEKFLIYMKKFPLYQQKQTVEKVPSKKSLSKSSKPVDQKLMRMKQFEAESRIEEGKEEDEEDTSSQFTMNENKPSTKNLREDLNLQDDQSNYFSLGKKETQREEKAPSKPIQSQFINEEEEESEDQESSREEEKEEEKVNPGAFSNNQQNVMNELFGRAQTNSKLPKNKPEEFNNSQQNVMNELFGRNSAANINAPSSNPPGEFSNSQQNVMNELFGRVSNSNSNFANQFKNQNISDNESNKLEQMSSSSNQKTEDDKVEAIANQIKSQLGNSEAPNFNQMDKEAKKEGLNNLLSAAFSMLPPD